jgi:hypothetical protein
MPEHVQEDLFGEVAARLAAHAERRELRHRFEAVKHRRPDTGRDLGAGMWCGRCGATAVNEAVLLTNHDTGWTVGCYLALRPGAAGHWAAHLTAQQRLDRWDRQFFGDCTGCGHPWGLHGWDIGGGSHHQHAGCMAVIPGCGCRRYTPR